MAGAIAAVAMVNFLNTLGFGWAFTGLGFLDVLCIPGVILILVRGEKWRENLKRQQQQG
jgi:hypothetical protein